jgi:L-seryl-tRNA(Ser) seleniumtransferase
VDKLTLAALEATLAGPRPPVAVALAASIAAIKQRAERLAARLDGHGLDAHAVATEAAVGGGGAPCVALPSAAVSLPAGLADVLRAGQAVRSGAQPAVVGRVMAGRLLLDLRAVAPQDDDLICEAVIAAAGG